MKTVDFIRKARELTDALERFLITRSRLCAVTLHSGDGICVAFDRSDRSSAEFHQLIHDAFPHTSVILSYEPQNKIYQEIIPTSKDTLSDPEALKLASNRFNIYVNSNSGSRPVNNKADNKSHAVFTELGVFICAEDLESLKTAVFRLEEKIKNIETLKNIKKRAMIDAGTVSREITEKLRAMDSGDTYIRARKRKE